MAALTEQEILNIVYSLYETDNDNWATDSAEYLSGRMFANAAIVKWEKYDNTTWRDLWTKLDDADDGTKTITTGTWSYDTPTNFIRPSSWVRTADSNSTNTFWEVVPPEKIAGLADSNEKYCYFTGSIKEGFYLNFNPRLTLTTGHTINYEYYKAATQLSASTDTTEVPDPYYIIYYVLSRFLRNDGEDNRTEIAEASSLLENMRVANMTAYWEMSDRIPDSPGNTVGFGL